MVCVIAITCSHFRKEIIGGRNRILTFQNMSISSSDIQNAVAQATPSLRPVLGPDSEEYLGAVHAMVETDQVSIVFIWFHNAVVSREHWLADVYVCIAIYSTPLYFFVCLIDLEKCRDAINTIPSKLFSGIT